MEFKKLLLGNQTTLNKFSKASKIRKTRNVPKVEEEENFVVPKQEDFQGNLSYLETIIIKEEPSWEPVKEENLLEYLDTPDFSEKTLMPISSIPSIRANKKCVRICDVCGLR